MATSPSFLYFDLGNVLLDFDHRLGARQMAKVAGVSEQVAWEVVFESDLEMEYERGAVTSRQFYEAFCRRTGTAPDFDDLLLAGSDIFTQQESTVSLAMELRNQGRRLGILSNTNESHWNFVINVRFPMIAELFDVYALSHEMRAVKPDLAAYRIATELAGVAPDEIFFTDDRAENVVGAREAGFDAVQFVGAEALRAELRSRGQLA